MSPFSVWNGEQQAYSSIIVQQNYLNCYRVSMCGYVFRRPDHEVLILGDKRLGELRPLLMTSSNDFTTTAFPLSDEICNRTLMLLIAPVLVISKDINTPTGRSDTRCFKVETALQAVHSG